MSERHYESWQRPSCSDEDDRLIEQIRRERFALLSDAQLTLVLLSQHRPSYMPPGAVDLALEAEVRRRTIGT